MGFIVHDYTAIPIGVKSEQTRLRPEKLMSNRFEARLLLPGHCLLLEA
jgi:hypothetical protein